MSVTRILQTAGGLTRPLTARDLVGLSSLRQIDRREFLETWATLTEPRRSALAREMIEVTEEHVELQLGEVWRWLLDDQDALVRLCAIEGLWEDTSARTMRRMLAQLRSDPSVEVRAAAASALSRFAYLAALDELDEGAELLERSLSDIVFDQSAPLDVRRRALESAGYFAENDPIQAEIERSYASDEQLLRESALVAMGRSLLPRWLPTISAALTHRSPAIRYEASRAAGEMAEDARSLLPKLAPLLNDSDTEVAISAIWALGQIGSDAAQRALEQAKRSEDEARSQAAAEALEELRAGDSMV